MDEIKYPALPRCEPLEGNEPICLGERQLATVKDFWQWAYSNVNDNASRGRFAEYPVCAALGCAQGTRNEWDPYDILWDGIKVEVKSSAYLQTWGRRELSRILFGIQPTRFWDPATNLEDEVARRQADVYVFCIENCKDQTDGNPNPLDLSQWEFRVIATRLLDTLGGQKTISLPQLEALGAERVGDAFGLPEAVRRAVGLRDGC